MINYQTSVISNSFKISLILLYMTVPIPTFLTFLHYPIFSINTNHFINNDQYNSLCHEAWSLDLVSTKLFCSGKNPLFEVWTMYSGHFNFNSVNINGPNSHISKKEQREISRSQETQFIDNIL